MSNATITNFCNFVESIIVNDNVTNFHIRNKDYLVVISSISPSHDIISYIKYIFSYRVITENSINGVILYAINIINLIRKTGLYLNNLTSHRIILVCLLLASKLYEDEFYSNKSWSIICGINIKDLNNIELFLIKLLDYNLHIMISNKEIIAISKCLY